MNNITNLIDLIKFTNEAFPGYGITEIFQTQNGELHTTSNYDLNEEILYFIENRLMGNVTAVSAALNRC